MVTAHAPFTLVSAAFAVIAVMLKKTNGMKLRMQVLLFFTQEGSRFGAARTPGGRNRRDYHESAKAYCR